MQSMFDTEETENQLIFVEKLYFRAINSGYRIESYPCDIMCVHTNGREAREGVTKGEYNIKI